MSKIHFLILGVISALSSQLIRHVTTANTATPGEDQYSSSWTRSSWTINFVQQSSKFIIVSMKAHQWAVHQTRSVSFTTSCISVICNLLSSFSLRLLWTGMFLSDFPAEALHVFATMRSAFSVHLSMKCLIW